MNAEEIRQMRIQTIHDLYKNVNLQVIAMDDSTPKFAALLGPNFSRRGIADAPEIWKEEKFYGSKVESPNSKRRKI